MSRIFVGSITFLQGSHLFAELGHGGFVKPVRTAAFTQNPAAATWLHISSIPAIQVQWNGWILADFSKTFQSFRNGSLTDWDFLHSSYRMQKLLLVRLWFNSDGSQPDLW